MALLFVASGLGLIVFGLVLGHWRLRMLRRATPEMLPQLNRLVIIETLIELVGALVMAVGFGHGLGMF